METIYVVGGTTGAYSDRTDWTVCAYRDKDKADAHVHNAMLRAKELQKAGGWNSYDKSLPQNEFDPKMQMDYTGTEYFSYAVELRD